VSLCDRDLESSIKNVLLKAAPDDPLFGVHYTSTFCRTLVLATRPEGLQRAAHMCSYGTKYHDPFHAKISQVAYAILAAPGILLPLNIDGTFYAEASEWNNPTAEAMKEARDIWPDHLIKFINIGTGIEDPQPPPEQQWSLKHILSGLSPNSKLLKWASELSGVSERIHEEVISNYVQEGWQYIRLNIHQGLSTVGLKKWEEGMPAFVEEYMESPEIQQEIKEKLL
jgi:hypothetical protein